MRLNVNLQSLHNSVARMSSLEVDFDLAVRLSDLDSIDARLETGIEVKIDDIEILDNGLLSYKDRQVLLYIQDHGWSITEAIDDGGKGKKYHVSYCVTLDSMHGRGRYDRYVAKHDISGFFYIDGISRETEEYEDGETQLNVCKNCLKHLNYQDYDDQSVGRKKRIFNGFSAEVFFDTYQQYFKYKPKFQSGKTRSSYTDDWLEVSHNYRVDLNWKCEDCGIICLSKKSLLHTHHKNGVKSDNSPSNLQALCVECHSKKPYHSHMYIRDDQLVQLREMRGELGAG
jgi:hypothetical protein